MNLTPEMEEAMAYVRTNAAPEGLEVECLTAFFGYVSDPTTSPGQAANMALYDWDI